MGKHSADIITPRKEPFSIKLSFLSPYFKSIPSFAAKGGRNYSDKGHLDIVQSLDVGISLVLHWAQVPCCLGPPMGVPEVGGLLKPRFLKVYTGPTIPKASKLLIANHYPLALPDV